MVCRALARLLSDAQRGEDMLRQADYRFLVRVAYNIVGVASAVHHSGCVIGDINHSAILVSEKATLAFIDADSFQFSDGRTSYLCRVGVPEYTPPELIGQKLDGITRTQRRIDCGEVRSLRLHRMLRPFRHRAHGQPCVPPARRP